MVFQRLAENLRTQNWTTVAIEVLVLTLGVFLGLQVENWNQNRIDRVKARDYSERLIADFTAIRDRSTQLIAEIDRELEALSQISELTDGNGTNPDVDYSALIQELSNYSVPPPRSASYIDILESNNLDLFQDRSHAEALIRCDDDLQSFLSAFEIRRQIVRESSGPFLGLILDIEDLSFQDAIRLVDTEARPFRRELTLHRTIRQADRSGFEGIVDCSTQVVEKLATRN